MGEPGGEQGVRDGEVFDVGGEVERGGDLVGLGAEGLELVLTE